MKWIYHFNQFWALRSWVRLRYIYSVGQNRPSRLVLKIFLHHRAETGNQNSQFSISTPWDLLIYFHSMILPNVFKQLTLLDTVSNPPVYDGYTCILFRLFRCGHTLIVSLFNNCMNNALVIGDVMVEYLHVPSLVFNFGHIPTRWIVESYGILSVQSLRNSIFVPDRAQYHQQWMRLHIRQHLLLPWVQPCGIQELSGDRAAWWLKRLMMIIQD